jgi:hypothetical protein
MFKKDFLKKPVVVFTFSTMAVCLIGYANVKIYQQKQLKLAEFKQKKLKPERALASDSGYRFGGSCDSQGSWTKQALSQTAVIRDIINTLKDDPNCKGIEAAVGSLKTAENYNQDTDREGISAAGWDSLPGEMKALTSLMGKGGESNRKDVIQVLMGKTIENTVLSGNIKNLMVRSERTMSTGLTLLNQTLDVLPSMDKCLSGHPDQALALFGASLKLTSAFLSSGDTPLGKMGTTVAKLVTYLQNKKYSGILKGLNESEYWMSMSCILETTTEAYCAASDAYDMQQYSMEEKSLQKTGDAPLEGYYILVRELPIITNWLQKVQLGVQPRRKADVAYTTETLDNYNDFKKTQLDLMVTYAEQMDLVTAAKTQDEKMQRVYDMVIKLNRQITGGSGQNFFTSGMAEIKIPFYLIGINAVPVEVSGAGGTNMRQRMSTAEYLQQGGAYLPVFHSPDALASRIGENLKSLINTASDSAGEYFQARTIVDPANLVDESVTSQNLTVYKSLKNVSNYLDKLIEKSAANRTNKIQIKNMIETKLRIDEVVEKYDVIDKIVDGYLADLKTDKTKVRNAIAEDKELTQAYEDIINTAYKNFNVLRQNDTYLTTRLSTFVRKDYMDRVSSGVDMTEHQRQLMIVAGKNLVDRVGAVNQLDPEGVRADLSTAQVVNSKNINAVEQLFRAQFVGMIARIKDIAEGNPNDKGSLSRSSLRRLYADSKIHKESLFVDWILSLNPLTPSTPMRMAINYYANKDKYPIEFFSSGKIKSEEDIFKSFKLFHAKLCAQALAFQNKKDFYDVCDGVVLEPLGAAPEDKAGLSVNFTLNTSHGLSPRTVQELGGREEVLAHSSKDVSRIWRARNICAYRNFRSKNYAYWLVKSFGEKAREVKENMSLGNK